MAASSGPDLPGRVFGVELVTRRGWRSSPLTLDDVYEVIESLIQIDVYDLEVIQMHGPDPNRVDVTMASMDAWHRNNIQSFLERKCCLSNSKTVRLVQPCEQVENIRIRRVPSWWREEDLRRVIGFYGNIRDVYKEKFRNNIDPNKIRIFTSRKNIENWGMVCGE